MLVPRPIRIVLLFAPLLLFALVLALPQCSARLSLLAHGIPFARVVPKQRLDIFRYVQADNLRYQAVVFSGGKPAGLIVQPLGWVAEFEPLSGQPDSLDGSLSNIWFGLVLLGAWSLRWFLLPVQAILLLFWLRQRERKTRKLAPADTHAA